MNKYSPRSEIFSTPDQQPEYSPNKELVLPKLVRSIEFEKVPKRTKLFSVNEDIPNKSYNVKYDAIDKKMKYYDISKDIPRVKNINSPLPSYLQIAMNSTELNKTCNYLKKFVKATSLDRSAHSSSEQNLKQIKFLN